jgi:hypothetical protein
VGVATVAPPVATAQDPDAAAKAKFDLGRQHFEAGRFAEAAAAFEEAYRISQRPALLYNLYLAYRDANDMPHAATALRGYLEKTTDVENRPLLEAKLAAMEQSLRAPPAMQPAPTPQPATPAAAPPPATVEAPAPAAPAAATEPDEPPRKTNLLPFILMGTGGAMVVGGVVTGAMAGSAQSELEEACPTRMNCDASLADTQSRGETLALVTDILIIGGIAAGGAGVVLFVLDGMAETSSTGTPSASLACLPGACAATVRGRF